MDPLTAIGLLLSVLINFWQFNTSGELRAERDNYQSIAENCTTDRKAERRTTIEAADAREHESAALSNEFTRQKQYTRDSLKDASDTCLDTHSILGSELVDGEQQTTRRINGIWLRGSSKSND